MLFGAFSELISTKREEITIPTWATFHVSRSNGFSHMCFSGLEEASQPGGPKGATRQPPIVNLIQGPRVYSLS